MDLCKFYNFIEYISSDRDIDIYIDTQEYYPSDALKIYFQSEPGAIYNCYEFLKTNSHLYDYILCYDDTKLMNCTNVIVKLCGATWITDHSLDTEKQYKISNICGSKQFTPSHVKRIELYNRQLEFNEWPITFFRSSAGHILPDINNNPFIGLSLESKIDLFKDFQFSIVIENSSERNYFSEKLIDCLITKTIPIYYGCPNIEDYFDTRGWIIIDSDDIVNELKHKLRILDSSYYSKYIEAIDANYEKAKYHGNFFNGCLDALRQIPGIKYHMV